MQAIMLYMSGSGIQIFSMGIVWMLLTSPFKACMNIIQSEQLSWFVWLQLFLMVCYLFDSL
jgi:hypothetical protein